MIIKRQVLIEKVSFKVLYNDFVFDRQILTEKAPFMIITTEATFAMDGFFCKSDEIYMAHTIKNGMHFMVRRVYKHEYQIAFKKIMHFYKKNNVEEFSKKQLKNLQLEFDISNFYIITDFGIKNSINNSEFFIGTWLNKNNLKKV
jgi:hypothetical protein